MATEWISATAGDVQVGDRVRLASGRELQVSAIEKPFFGREEMLAFIEETNSSWFKQPAQLAADVEIEHAS